MTPRNQDTANIDQDWPATPADGDTVPEGEWVAGTAPPVDTVPATDTVPAAGIASATDTAGLDAPAAGAHAVPPAATPAGSVAGPGAAAGAAFVTNADEHRASWVRIQSGFVDDPHASVTAAADLVGQISGSLVSAVQERERTLRGSWASGGNADTEALRNALREYRSFFERLMRI